MFITRLSKFAFAILFRRSQRMISAEAYFYFFQPAKEQPCVSDLTYSRTRSLCSFDGEQKSRPSMRTTSGRCNLKDARSRGVSPSDYLQDRFGHRQLIHILLLCKCDIADGRHLTLRNDIPQGDNTFFRCLCSNPVHPDSQVHQWIGLRGISLPTCTAYCARLLSAFQL